MSDRFTTLTPDDLEERAAIAFLEQYVDDRSSGRLRPLAQYLAQFAHCEARIAHEWLLLRGQQPMPVPASGSEVADHIGAYRLVRELGRGAQGVVYLAEDTRLGRKVALKVLTRGVAAVSGPATLRLRREAEAIAKLDHAGIATIFETGFDSDPPWIAMRFVAGGTLQQLIADRVSSAGPPQSIDDITHAARSIERAARALAYAHAAGILHRDIKPGNLLLAASDEPVLTDFGLAVDENARTPTVTLPGAVLGTLAYLAPERLSGAEADARADVYSLGAVLFELLTLRRPYAAETTAKELMDLEHAPAPAVRASNPAVPGDLAVIVATAIAKAPADRYASATAFADDLARYLAREPIAARPASLALRLKRWAQRNPLSAWTLAALLLVLSAGLTATTLLWRRSSQALDDVRRLSDLKLARELREHAATLWPSRPELVPALQKWHDDLEVLQSRQSLHEKYLASLPQLGIDVTADWGREQVTALLAIHRELSALDQSILKRRDFAARLQRQTIEVPAAAWQAASARIRANPVYSGMQLPPQLGLVPLGADRATSLEEFAHVLTGNAPTRDPQTGSLQLTEATCVVLVLIPGGRSLLGADRKPGNAAQPANIDPDLLDEHTQSYVLDLEPFFLSRYEMTQSQWLRHTGTNPATYRVGGSARTVSSGLHPVEQVTWEECERVLRQLDLQLPTEAQWEHAYRAGTNTPFPFGPNAQGLIGRENLSDVTARTLGANPRQRFIEWLDDGWVVHAPVGSFAPNAWGLHDMGGNVKEWCADYWEYYKDVAPRAGDGQRRGKSEEYRIVRGGSFASYLDDARSAARVGVTKHARGTEAGVRPGRRVDGHAR